MTARSAMNQQVPFIQKERKETEVDCICNFSSVFCRRKKPYLKPLNILSAELSVNIITGVFCPKSMGFFSRSQKQSTYGNFCYMFEFRKLVKKYNKKVFITDCRLSC